MDEYILTEKINNKNINKWSIYTHGIKGNISLRMKLEYNFYNILNILL